MLARVPLWKQSWRRREGAAWVCRRRAGEGESGGSTRSRWATQNDQTKKKKTHLLHDASLALGEGDVAARLVADELDLNLATFAAALLVLLLLLFGRVGAGALNAAVLIDSSGAIADGMGLVELGGRRGCLVVLLSDVGHFFSVRVSRGTKKAKWWRCCFERGADGLDWIWR